MSLEHLTPEEQEIARGHKASSILFNDHPRCDKDGYWPWPCPTWRLLTTIDGLRGRMKEVIGKVMMIDASPAGSLNTQLKIEALDILQGGSKVKPTVCPVCDSALGSNPECSTCKGAGR